VPEKSAIILPTRRISDVRRLPGFPHLSEEHAAAVGYIAGYWSRVEDMMAWIIQDLIDQSFTEAGQAITAEPSPVARIDTITTLMASVRNREWYDEWCVIADAAHSIRGKRNDAIHAVWIKHGHEQKVIRTKARLRVTIEVKAIPISELETTKEDILDLTDALGDFMGSLIKSDAHKRLHERHTTLPLNRGPSPKALAQAQARQSKKDRQNADRERSKKERRPLPP
jgi:hypothetical protein